MRIAFFRPSDSYRKCPHAPPHVVTASELCWADAHSLTVHPAAPDSSPQVHSTFHEPTLHRIAKVDWTFDRVDRALIDPLTFSKDPTLGFLDVLSPMARSISPNSNPSGAEFETSRVAGKRG